MDPDSKSNSQSEPLPRQLREALYLNKLILESAGEGIYGLDLEGKVTFINRAAVKMTGFTTKEIIGNCPHKLFHHSKPDVKHYKRDRCPSFTRFLDNKIDKASRQETMAQLIKAADWPFKDIYPLSAIKGDGVAVLIEELVRRLPQGPRYYPEGMTTDQPENLVIAEIVREKFLRRLREELPHSLTVRIEEMDQRESGLIDITADVVVERKSQKGIVIGKGGSLLQKAGTEAREELEQIIGNKVNLNLRVVDAKDWQRRPRTLDRMGFDRA